MENFNFNSERLMKLGAVAKLYKTSPSTLKNSLIVGLKTSRIPQGSMRTLITITDLGRMRHEVFVDMANRLVPNYIETDMNTSEMMKKESKTPRVNKVRSHKTIEFVDNIINRGNKKVVAKRDGTIVTKTPRASGKKKMEAKPTSIWMTIVQYTVFAKVSAPTVYNMIADGRLETRKMLTNRKIVVRTPQPLTFA